jgi:hypothetical protein
MFTFRNSPYRQEKHSPYCQQVLNAIVREYSGSGKKKISILISSENGIQQKGHKGLLLETICRQQIRFRNSVLAGPSR